MRLRAVLASAAMLSGLRTVGAEPCAPRANLAGDRAAITRVAEELARLGVTVTDDASTNECAVVRARVELADASGGIAVAVQGANRGSEGRVVSDAALAAAWIDSWTRQDVDTALWAPPPRVSTAIGPALTPPSVVPVDTAPRATTPSTWDRFALSASYAQSWSDDDASWTGLDVSGCVRVAGFCIGGSVRAMFDGERVYNATSVARSDISVLAIGRYPISIGRMSIAPELGAGVGRLATRRAESTCKLMPPPNCNPMDPMCPQEPVACDPTDPGTTTPKYYVGDGFSATTFAPRVTLAVRVAVPLFEHVWLDALAGFVLSPFSHAGSFVPEIDAGAMIPAESVALPGEPSSGYGIGIGLRVGSK